MKSLSASWFFFEFTTCFAISLWIHCLFREFTLNPFFRWITMNYLLRNFPLNSLSYSQNRYEFSIFFANLLSVSRLVHKKHYLLDDFNMNSPSFPQFNLEFTIYFVISLRIHYIYREFILNTRSVSRIYYEFTNLFASHVSHVSHEPITWWCRYDYGMKKSIRNHYVIVAVTLMA